LSVSEFAYKGLQIINNVAYSTDNLDMKL
jgi:hypothetical protein